MKTWQSNRLETFCPYCSRPTDRLRLNFNNKSNLTIKCDSCGKEYVLLIGAQNLKDYLELIINVNNSEEKNSYLKLSNLHCPFDGQVNIKYKSEAVSMDEYEDVDMERFVLCNSCRRKFTLIVLDLSEDNERNYWLTMRNTNLDVKDLRV